MPVAIETAWVWAEGLLAAISPPDVGNLTATAILGWYAWHTASRTIPQLVQAFRDELAAAREEFRQERAAFHETLTREREQRQRDHRMLAAALHGMSRPGGSERASG